MVIVQFSFQWADKSMHVALTHAHSHISTVSHHNHRYYWFAHCHINKQTPCTANNRLRREQKKNARNSTHKTKLPIAVVHIERASCDCLFAHRFRFFRIFFISFRLRANLLRKSARRVRYWHCTAHTHGIHVSHIVCYSQDDCMQRKHFLTIFVSLFWPCHWNLCAAKNFVAFFASAAFVHGP